MRRLVLLLAFVALATVGCMNDDSDSDSSSSPPPPAATTVSPPPVQTTTPSSSGRKYTLEQLAKLALQPADAPAGFRYSKAESGRKKLDEIGVLLDVQTRELQQLGYRAVYDSIFDSTKNDVRLASRMWLFAEPRGAERWLARTESNSLGVALQPLPAPTLGDDSWAAGGNLNGNDLITHAFRSGNVVVVQTLSTQSQQLAEADALAAAQKAATRFR